MTNLDGLLAQLDGVRAELEVLREDVDDALVRELVHHARRDLDAAVRRVEDLEDLAGRTP